MTAAPKRTPDEQCPLTFARPAEFAKLARAAGWSEDVIRRVLDGGEMHAWIRVGDARVKIVQAMGE
jgi:hypothetical protein